MSFTVTISEQKQESPVLAEVYRQTVEALDLLKLINTINQKPRKPRKPKVKVQS